MKTKVSKKVTIDGVEYDAVDQKIYTCEPCQGQGLKDQHTLCPKCQGTGGKVA